MRRPDTLTALVPRVDPEGRLVFIINAASGSHAPEEKRAAIEAALAEAGREGELRFVRPADLAQAADAAARTAMQRRSAVVAVGGVGQNIVQLAAVSGAEPVIAIDVDDDKLDLARRMGATHTVNSSRVDAAEAIAEITGGRGVDVAFEALGSAATTNLAVDITREGGRAVVVGIPPAGTTLDVDLARIVRRKIQIKGSYGARARRDVPDLIRLLAAGRLDLGEVISRRVSLDEAPETYQALDRGEILGRAVVLTGG